MQSNLLRSTKYIYPSKKQTLLIKNYDRVLNQ
jgi:hypothetical protein